VVNAQSNHPEQPPADTQAGRAVTVRELFDINTFYDDRPGRAARWVIRVILGVLGSIIGWILWRIVDEDSVGDRSFVEEMLGNAYIWACLITTMLFGMRDWRGRRRRAKTD
jgi:hypothetical protein